MAKKIPGVPRVAQGTAKTDVVTRIPPEDISHRAYSLFQARGREHGHDVEDWLVAEAELLEGHSRNRQREPPEDGHTGAVTRL